MPVRFAHRTPISGPPCSRPLPRVTRKHTPTRSSHSRHITGAQNGTRETAPPSIPFMGMARIRPIGLLIAVLLALAAIPSTGSANPGGPVRGVVLQGTIDPATAQFVTRRLENADSAGAGVFIIQMDTPGGLMSSMHDIVRAMESAQVPTVVWVGPAGSRAGSAGAFISAAADLLYMAPGTNIGSATPVSSGGGDLDVKVRNDAAAQIQALAEARGRNAQLFRSMVTEGSNFPASEAVRDGIATGIATDRDHLLQTLNGVKVDGVALTTEGVPVRFDDMPWYLRLLQVLIDPNLLTALFGLGIAAIGYEIFNPGGIVPGVVGVILLLTAAVGLAMVPFNWAGIAFLLLAFVLFALEAAVSGFGVLAAGGVVSLVIGGLILFDDAQGPVVSRPGLIICAVIVGGAFTLIARAAVRARRAPRTTGRTGLIGHVGQVRRDIADGRGQVFVEGELWAAVTADGVRIPAGRRVRVTRMQDLTLTVEAEPEESP